jgi:coenzyme F420-0:L-glutamate ligase/coenzyme F420-1:gamma-L-glutamate ligase
VSIEVFPLEGLPEVGPQDDLAALLSEPLASMGVRDGDVVAVTQKIVSKAEGRVVPLGDGREAWVERETRRVVARRGDLVIAETRHGFVCASAGVDASNAPQAGTLVLLPLDPDGSASRIRARLRELTGVAPGVVVSDSFGRAWRQGTTDVALGVAGFAPLRDLRGTSDAYGRELETTQVAVADEIASAAELVLGKAHRVPAAIVRGVDLPAGDGSGADIVMPRERDLFR